jgi:hypothetical protein
VGLLVGWEDGETVGCIEGLEVGLSVDRFVGKPNGCLVGVEVGCVNSGRKPTWSISWLYGGLTGRTCTRLNSRNMLR